MLRIDYFQSIFSHLEEYTKMLELSLKFILLGCSNPWGWKNDAIRLYPLQPVSTATMEMLWCGTDYKAGGTCKWTVHLGKRVFTNLPTCVIEGIQAELKAFQIRKPGGAKNEGAQSSHTSSPAPVLSAPLTSIHGDGSAEEWEHSTLCTTLRQRDSELLHLSHPSWPALSRAQLAPALRLRAGQLGRQLGWAGRAGVGLS
ncbi:hypothetical protein FA13DRAFT_1720810 [Coprinellus micaceus]|uniref:Uncharacterized protein n=1 Tax=Coprinellus micaceus TaxID=71717 RepID=A0A4Y7S5M3_COPMI|nr:hypothetical protein FA13DRAFT_1720810 [Coprinellus micaceus]